MDMRVADESPGNAGQAGSARLQVQAEQQPTSGRRSDASGCVHCSQVGSRCPRVKPLVAVNRGNIPA